MPRKQKKFHIIYKTTCIVSNRYYIGMHSTDDLNDGYIGSGKRLKYSIKKHGVGHHKFEIIEFMPDRESLISREAEIVNENLLTDKQCMNLRLGGFGGWDHINLDPDKKKTTQRARGQAGRKNSPGFSGRTHTEESKMKMRAFQVDGAGSSGFKGKSHSQQTREKMRKSKNRGSSNSQFGLCWMHHDLIGSKRCKKDDLPLFIEQGWIKGRKDVLP